MAETMVERSLDSYFLDWEAEVFGFGYGSGEPHVLTALHAFFGLCPPPDADSRGYDYQALETALTPTVAWLLINALGHADVIEYGSSPRYAWLTDKGYRLRAFVLSKTPEELSEMTCLRDQDHPCCTPRYCNCNPYDHTRSGPCLNNPFYNDKLPALSPKG